MSTCRRPGTLLYCKFHRYPRRLSNVRRELRSDAHEVTLSAFPASAAPGRACTYGTSLRTVIPNVRAELGVPVPPMASGASFYGFRATVLPKLRSAPPLTSQPSAR